MSDISIAVSFIIAIGVAFTLGVFLGYSSCDRTKTMEGVIQKSIRPSDEKNGMFLAAVAKSLRLRNDWLEKENSLLRSMLPTEQIQAVDLAKAELSRTQQEADNG